MGDYCSGPNHTLPTYGYAKAYSGLSLEDFQKRITVQELTPAGLRDLGPTAQVLAGLEGLDAHAAAVTIRLAALGDGGVAMNAVLVPLARPEIVTLKPYAHAAWLPSLTRLHANEAPWRPAGDTTAAGLNRYPEPQPQALDRAAWPRCTACPRTACSRRAAATRPSMCCRAFTCAPARMPSCNARRPSACTRWRRASRAPRSSRFRCDRERGWALDAERLLAAWRPHIKLVYLCSPNNPTANLLDAAALEAHLHGARRQGHRRDRRGLHRMVALARA